jgi:hypothetical protein
MNADQQLRDLFTADADAAPAADGLLAGAMGKVRHRRRAQAAWVAGAVGVAVAATVIAPSLAREPVRAPAAARPTPTVVGTVPPGKAGRPLGGGGAASCAFGYSPAMVAQRAEFAFDGTVIAVGASISNHGGAGDLPWLAGVTLRVNAWFKGGTAATVVVDLPAPLAADVGLEDVVAPQYGVGTRLLVSGAPRWGGADPLASAIAWGCGGFTRYYSPADAVRWAAATR